MKIPPLKIPALKIPWLSSSPALRARARKTSNAILGAPHTLLCLPRHHTGTFWRSLTILAGLTMVYLGVEEARLRATCRSPEELSARELAARHDSPVWVRVQGIAPPAEVAVESSESGSFKGIWLPLVSEEDPRTVVAVLRAPDRGTAASLQTGKRVVVEGMAYFPRPVEEKNLGVYLHWLDRPAADTLRILEIGRTPSGWLGVVLYLVLGLALFAHAFISKWKTPDFGPGDAEGHEQDMLVTLNDYQSDPLPEGVKLEVGHMLDNAWAEVEGQK